VIGGVLLPEKKLQNVWRRIKNYKNVSKGTLFIFSRFLQSFYGLVISLDLHLLAAIFYKIYFSHRSIMLRLDCPRVSKLNDQPKSSHSSVPLLSQNCDSRSPQQKPAFAKRCFALQKTAQKLSEP
jgi:hypothetical protein